MSTISSSLPSLAGSAYPQLGLSLASLSGGTQPAVLPDDPAGTADPAAAADPLQEIARQNRLSALADSSAALAATQSAQALITGQPAAALAGQATVPADAAWGLLQG
jgi:hypothetical protein